MDTLIGKIATIITALILVFGTGLLLAWRAMWLWNWVVVLKFGLPTLNYWETWALMVLCSVLFKSTTSIK